MQSNDESYFKILIGDKNIKFRDTLGNRLRLEGFYVEFATGGFHLLHVIEKSKDCSLVILHEDMDDMPAIEIISLIRISNSKTDLPILFISQDNNEEEICNKIVNGANEYIVKAPNFQPIVESVKKYFALLKNS